MKTYVTSDLHFEHRNIFKFCPTTRAKYGDITRMTDAMINEWNDIVEPCDKVYILGDVAFCNAERAVEILGQLNGNKILVEGNHDRKLLKNEHFRKCFSEIHTYLDINYNGHKIVMFHFPIFDHDQAGRGSIMLHGHRHGTPTNIPGKIMDVGLDATGNIVTCLDDILEKMKDVPHMYHNA